MKYIQRAELEHRPLWTVMLDLVAGMDAVVRDMHTELRDGTASVGQLDTFVDRLETAAKVTKMAMDSGVAERQTRQLEVNGVVIGTVLRNVAQRMNFTFEQKEQMMELINEEIRNAGTMAIPDQQPDETKAEL